MPVPDPIGTSQVQDSLLSPSYAAALRFLSCRPRSEAEVRRRLSGRCPPDLVDRVMTTLREQGFLDDAAFARYWRENRERHRPKGQIMLRQELLRLGVPRDTVGVALEGFDAAGNAYRAGGKLARRLAQSNYLEYRHRMSAYLQRRGFSGTVVRETVERLWRELTDSLHGDERCYEEQEQG